MARITWIGEGEGTSPTVTWYGHELRVGEVIEITDERLIVKAKGSRFFKVEEGPVVPVTQWREPATEADPADEDEDEDEPRPAPPRAAAKPKHRPVKHR